MGGGGEYRHRPDNKCHDDRSLARRYSGGGGNICNRDIVVRFGNRVIGPAIGAGAADAANAADTIDGVPAVGDADTGDAVTPAVAKRVLVVGKGWAVRAACAG